jgi:hypothetical protein
MAGAVGIARLRLRRQAIADPRFDTPADVVRWFGAMQAQDYLGASWAVGLRMRDATQASVEQAIADRSIVRTWPMRGTLHFVAADDVRWMQALLAPRVIARDRARIERDFGLDSATLKRCRRIVDKALADGTPVTRSALYAALDAGGIASAGQRGLHVTGRLAHEGVLCLGPRAGKQPTFVLLDAWLPATPDKSRDEALAELARRYFASHAPATVQDFAWWSGLTVKEAQAGIALAQADLVRDDTARATYWRTCDAVQPAPPGSVHLLPPFDEYLVGYKDRSAALDPAFGRAVIGINGLVNASIVVDGRVVGTWKRSVGKDTVTIAPTLLAAIKRSATTAIKREARRYGAFLGVQGEADSAARHHCVPEARSGRG